MKEKAITVNEAAERTGRCKGTIINLCKSGVLKSERFGKSYMIDPASLPNVETVKRGRPATGRKKPKHALERLADRLQKMGKEKLAAELLDFLQRDTARKEREKAAKAKGKKSVASVGSQDVE